MAAQVEIEASRLHLSPLTDSSNKGLMEGSPGPQSSLIINPEPRKPLPGPKPRLTPKPFSVERNPTIRPILAPKPNPKPRPESTRPVSYKPDKPEPPSTSKSQPVSKPRPTAGRPTSTTFKPGPKPSPGQTTKPEAQALKPVPTSVSTEHKKATPAPTGSVLRRTSLGPSTSQPKPSLHPPRPAAEWSGASRSKPVGTSMTRAKSMGYLPEAGLEGEGDKEANDVLRPNEGGPKSSRSRPVSAIFLADTTQQEPRSTAPAPAPHLTPRRPLSADLTSKFESIGLSLHRQKPTTADSKENTPEPPMQVSPTAQEVVGGANNKEKDEAENDEKSKASVLEKRVPEGEDTKPEEKGGSIIKRRISLLLDSSSSSFSLPATKGAEPRSPVQPIPDTDGAIGVKQRIKELTEDNSTAPTPPQKPPFKPRPLPSDLTKRFVSEVESPSSSEAKSLQESAEDPNKKFEDPFAMQSKPPEDKKPQDIQDSSILTSSNSSGMQTVRASLFDNVVERHNVQMVEDSGSPAGPMVKPLPRRNLSLRAKAADSTPKVLEDAEDGSLVTATYRQPESPSSPRRVEHVFDTLAPVEGIRAVSESVPSAHLEDQALTLRSRKSEGSERNRQAEDSSLSLASKKQSEASNPRILRVGAVQKWGRSEAVDPEKEKQKEMVRNMEEEIQRQLEVHMAAQADLEEEERQSKMEQQKQMEEERQRQFEAERQRQMEAERQWQFEAERQRQMEAERQRQLEAERQRQMVEERQRQIEAERQMEMERQRQMEMERQRQMEAERQKQIEEDREREEAAARRQKMVETGEHPVARPRATYFALTGQMNETVHQAAGLDKQGMFGSEERGVSEEPLKPGVPFDDFSVKAGRRGYPSRSASVRRNPSMDSSLRKSFTEEPRRSDGREGTQWNIPQSKERVMDESLEMERQLLAEYERKKDLEKQKDAEREQKRELERQRELEKEKARQRDLERQREKEREMERQRELDRQREAERQKQLERDRQKQIEYKKRKAAERELEEQREFERKRQKEYEREKERMLDQEKLKLFEFEKQKEMERERERQLELERQREIERQKQRELERQKEIERQKDWERQRELEKQRQTELERQKELEQQRELERQRDLERQKELKRQREMERQKELERQKQNELEQQKEMQRWAQSDQQKAGERERQRGRDDLERIKDLERHQLLEFQMQKESKKQTHQERERDKPLARTKKDEEVESQRVDEWRRQVSEQEKRTAESSLRPKVLDLDSVSLGDWNRSSSSRKEQPSPRIDEAYRPSILDIDSFRNQTQPEVSVDPFGMQDLAATKPVNPQALLQNLQPRPVPQHQQPSIPHPQLQSQPVHPQALLQNIQPNTIPQYQQPPSFQPSFTPEQTRLQTPLQPQILHQPKTPSQAFPQSDWASGSHQSDSGWQTESWGASQSELPMEEPLWVSASEGSRRPISTRPSSSIEQMLQQQERRNSGSVLSPILTPSVSTVTPTPTTITHPAVQNQGPSMETSQFNLLTPERMWTTPGDGASVSASVHSRETQPTWTPTWELASQESNQSQQRNRGTQESSRSRSRSVSWRSAAAAAESSVDGPLSRIRSRSAHRERVRPNWEQVKPSGQDEHKDTDTLVQETDSQYGTWETGLRTDESLTPATPSSDGLLTPSPRKPTPAQTPEEPTPADATPVDTPTSPAPAAEEPPEPLAFPETPTTLLDSSALRSRAQLGKRMSRRAPPSRTARHSAAFTQLTTAEEEEWRFRDSTEDKTDSKPQEEEKSDSEEQPRESRTPTSSAASSQPQRVSLFPGMDPSAIMAQLKKRGDGDTLDGPAPSASASASSSQLSRSPKSPFLPRAARVLPPAGNKENGEAAASPQWLKELKTKKRLSQYENES